MTPFATDVASYNSPEPVSGTTDDSMLIRVLFYPDGKKREFDYDDRGALRAIDHGDGCLWLRAEEKSGGWFVFTDSMVTPPDVCLYNVNLNQSTGDLRYDTETMHVIELTSGERITEKLK